MFMIKLRGATENCKNKRINIKGINIMNIQTDNNNIILEDVEDFILSQILECGQCFHFEKTDEEEYNIMAYGRALHIKQTDNNVILYNTSMEDYENVWKNYFDMENDYSVIKEAVRTADVSLTAAINSKAGIRILNQDFFETLISFIISQNKQITQIKQIVKNISHNFGTAVIGYNGDTFYNFPDAVTLNQVTEEELRLCKTGFRAPYIKDACEKVCNGEVTKEKMDKLSFYEARELLMTIKGVGEKVANCVLLFGLGRREAFPVDVWIKRIMEQMYFEGKDTKKNDIEAFAVEKFGKYGGYAQQYLFEYSRNK